MQNVFYYKKLNYYIVYIINIKKQMAYNTKNTHTAQRVNNIPIVRNNKFINNNDEYDSDEPLIDINNINSEQHYIYINNDSDNNREDGSDNESHKLNKKNKKYIKQPIYSIENNNVASTHNKHILYKQVCWYIFYCNVLILSGVFINIFSYNDINNIINNTTNTTNNNIISVFDINIKYIYYYISSILSFYVIYIFINIIIFVCVYVININNKILIIRLFKANNLFLSANILLRFLQFCALIMYIVNDTNILQIYITNNTYTDMPNNKTLNIYIPLYFNLIMLDTLLYIFISYMICITNGIINIIY